MVKFLLNNSRNYCGTTVGFVTQKKSVESTNKRFAVYYDLKIYFNGLSNKREIE